MVSPTRKRRYELDLSDLDGLSKQHVTAPASKRIRWRRHSTSHVDDRCPYTGTKSQQTPPPTHPVKDSVESEDVITRRYTPTTSNEQTKCQSTLKSEFEKDDSPIMLEQERDHKEHEELYLTLPPCDERKSEDNNGASFTVLDSWTSHRAQLPLLERRSVCEWQLEPALLCDPSGKDFEEAWDASLQLQQCRVMNYGREIAEEWKRGSTPEDARRQYAERVRALVEDISDSE